MSQPTSLTPTCTPCWISQGVSVEMQPIKKDGAKRWKCPKCGSETGIQARPWGTG